MTLDAHLSYHLDLLKQLHTLLNALTDIDHWSQDAHQELLDELQQLITEMSQGENNDWFIGQDLLCKVFSRYAQVAHLIPRDLLWFFGGDCLHFMPDEEIEAFQMLEDQRHAAEQAGEVFDWAKARQLQSLPNGSTH
ncbi:PA2817 family protein [Atopomonas sediminilitoris]|uniref:PA2817 family protein n=1 Tax=Atopomonas sediminilitoris TaxID=2919919 RepID=UPI001F4EBFCB|nr:PA2817 family protein [Atopomonas sediminilitoris]MCJ8168063.1 dehydrogenase [Atopomonas sediminilitoris]